MGLRWLAAFALTFSLLATHSILMVSPAATKIVGESARWTFGVNYTDWALKSEPFFINDTLVFKYDPPNSTTHPHSVYLLKNRTSFINCNLDKAKLVANVMQGSGHGFAFVLKERKKPYYFACGERGGVHCNAGLMKFSVFPFNRCKAYPPKSQPPY